MSLVSAHTLEGKFEHIEVAAEGKYGCEVAKKEAGRKRKKILITPDMRKRYEACGLRQLKAEAVEGVQPSQQRDGVVTSADEAAAILAEAGLAEQSDTESSIDDLPFSFLVEKGL